MLERLLHLLDDQGMLTTGELARRLGVSQRLVSIMLDDLARRGRLHKTNLPESDRPCPPDTGRTVCSGCQLSGSCKPAISQSWSR